MSRATVVASLFGSLAGSWVLDRELESANAEEPSGKCLGTATLTPRTPSPVLDEDGELPLADAEMLYHETGELKLPSGIRLPFSKMYIWRLKRNTNEPKLSIWFVKPGTDKIDYSFHTIDLSIAEDENQVHGSGGHLCVDDFYATAYTFNLSPRSVPAQDMGTLASWETVHEVRGPKKDQTITTRFSRS